MTKIEFYFGVGYDKDGNPISRETVDSAVQAIQHRAAELFGGVTLCKTRGSWHNHATDMTVHERGFVATVLMDTTENVDGKISALADLIKSELVQQSVVVVRQPVTVQFV